MCMMTNDLARRLPRGAAAVFAAGAIAVSGTGATSPALSKAETTEKSASWVWWAHDADERRSVGSVGSEHNRCTRWRTVLIKKQRPGKNKTIARDRTNGSSDWVMHHGDLNGKYYAVALKKRWTRDDGTVVTCRWDRSSAEKY